MATNDRMLRNSTVQRAGHHGRRSKTLCATMPGSTAAGHRPLTACGQRVVT